MFDKSILNADALDSVIDETLCRVTNNKSAIRKGRYIMLNRLDSFCSERNTTIAEAFADTELLKSNTRDKSNITYESCFKTLELLRTMYGYSKHQFSDLGDIGRNNYYNMLHRATPDHATNLDNVLRFISPLGITPAMFFLLTEILSEIDIDLNRIIHHLDYYMELEREHNVRPSIRLGPK